MSKGVNCLNVPKKRKMVNQRPSEENTHDWKRIKENLWQWFAEYFCLPAPTGSFQEETIDIGAVLGFSLYFARWIEICHFEEKSTVVDGNGVLSCVVLHHAGQERLCKVEAGQPERWRCPLGNPVGQKFQPEEEIFLIS